MRYLLIIPVLAAAALADVTWTYDFQELPEGWMNDDWTFGSSGASVFTSALGGAYTTDTGTMTSDTFVMPYGTTSVSVGVTDIWFFDGYATTGSSLASIEVIVYETTVNYTVEYDFQTWSAAMDDSGEGRSAYITFPAGEGTSFHIRFQSYADAEGAYAEVDWNVTELLVIARDAEVLQQSTWAGVKYSF